MGLLVRGKLASASPPDRARALRLVRQIGYVREVEEQIYRLAHDPDPMVRSAAIGCLQQLPGVTTNRILRGALGDSDARVQADAVEALDTLDVQDRVALTRPKLESMNNRVRANAVKSLLRTELQQAGETLLDMLDHTSRSHRLSALWVVSRLGLGGVVHRIETMSQSDPDEQVRRRAARVLEELVSSSEAHHSEGGAPARDALASGVQP